MGIIDKIKEFFATRESAKEADDALASVKQAADSQNYNQASLKAFYALEKVGQVFADASREEHETAREYGKKLVEDGYTTDDELEPILLSFEVAKYSENQVSSDDYSKVEKSLETVVNKFKAGAEGQPKSKGKRRRRKRRPRKGGKTGAAKTRKRRRRKKTGDE